MAPEAELVSQLIGDVYDAALQPMLWRDALKRVTEFVGGSAASLYWKNAIHRTGAVRHSWNLDPAFSYFNTQVKFDPVTVTQFTFGVEDIYSIGDLIPYDEFLQTRVYKEWAKPQGWVDHLAATLDKTSTSFALFGVFRNEQEGLVDDEMRRRMRLIVPHVRRAVLIGNVIDLHDEKSAMLADAFDTLAAGVFLVDAHCRIVFANATGRALLGRAISFATRRTCLPWWTRGPPAPSAMPFKPPGAATPPLACAASRCRCRCNWIGAGWRISCH
jgi:PAS domain-containing protein